MAILDFPHDKLGYGQRDVQATSPNLIQTTNPRIGKGSPFAAVVDPNFPQIILLNWYFSIRQFHDFEYMWETELSYGELPVLMGIPVESGYEERFVYINDYSYTVVSSQFYRITTAVLLDMGNLAEARVRPPPPPPDNAIFTNARINDYLAHAETDADYIKYADLDDPEGR